MNAAIVLFSAMMRQRYPPGTMYLAQPLVYENADPRPGDEGGALAGGVRKDQQQPRPAPPAPDEVPPWEVPGGTWEWDREDTAVPDPTAPRVLQLPIVYSKRWAWVYQPLGQAPPPPARGRGGGGGRGRGRGGRGVNASVVDDVLARLRLR